MMDPYPSMMALLPALLSALLCAGRTALTVLKDQSVKKMASSEDRRERSVARLLEKPAALLDGVKLACLFCNAAVVLLVYNTFSGMAVHLLQRLFSGAAPVWAVLMTHVLVFIAVVFLLDVLCTQLPYRAASRRPRGAAFALVACAVWRHLPCGRLQRRAAPRLNCFQGCSARATAMKQSASPRRRSA